MRCGLCGGEDAVPTGLVNVCARGVDQVRCTACGAKFFTEGVIPATQFYDSPAYDEYVRKDVEYGSPFQAEASELAWREAALLSYFTAHLERLREIVPGAITLYEVGCGAGRLLNTARGMGYQVGGCDASAANVAALLRFGITIEHALFQAATVPEGLDAVVMWDMIEHTHTPGADLDKVRACLRPGGGLLLKTFYDEWHDTRTLDLSSPSTGLEKTGYFAPDAHPYHFTSAVLLAALERRGLVPAVVSHDETYGQITVYATRA